MHFRALPQPGLNCAGFAVKQRMIAGGAILEPLDMQDFLVHVNVGQLQIAELAHPETMSEHKEQKTVVTLGIARDTREFDRLEESSSLLRGEMLSRTFFTLPASVWHKMTRLKFCSM